MLHKTVKAASTATDKGEFTAIAAAYSVDRGNEQIRRGAFADTIAKWQASGKQIPLHWDHSGDAKDIIGTVDPRSLRETEDGLIVRGQVHLEDSEVAREAWRLMKANAASLSFGFLAGVSEENAKGVTELDGIDMFEVSITPAPMNVDTRVLAMKSATKAEWTAAYINTLPDSSFLYVESGGSKDSEGKTTPRSLRHFPVKDASGKLDLPHLRNAAARIPQSNVPQSVKDRLASRVQSMLDNAKSQAIRQAPDGAVRRTPATPDPLRRRCDEVESHLVTRSVDLREVPEPQPEVHEPQMEVADLRARSSELMLQLLVGSED